MRVVGGEWHFEVVGKWAVDKWFRVPEAIYQELLAMKTSSPFVFAAYNQQLRRSTNTRPERLQPTMVDKDFNPGISGDWFYLRVRDWSASQPKGPAIVHISAKRVSSTLAVART